MSMSWPHSEYQRTRMWVLRGFLMGFSRVFDLLQEMTQQLWAGEKKQGICWFNVAFTVSCRFGSGGFFQFFFFGGGHNQLRYTCCDMISFSSPLNGAALFGKKQAIPITLTFHFENQMVIEISCVTTSKSGSLKFSRYPRKDVDYHSCTVEQNGLHTFYGFFIHLMSCTCEDIGCLFG